jgi:hypothetical protein
MNLQLTTVPPWAAGTSPSFAVLKSAIHMPQKLREANMPHTQFVANRCWRVLKNDSCDEVRMATLTPQLCKIFYVGKLRVIITDEF